ncbi:MAG: hypothetical protein RLY87_2349 [Chloroflexota bacterium]
MESFRERALFLSFEWSLILGWLATILLIWRQAAFYLLLALFDLGDAYDLVYTLVIFLLMIAAGVAVTATGFWLKRRPKNTSIIQRTCMALMIRMGVTPPTLLVQRWGLGWAWIGLFALTGYSAIVLPGGVFAP